MKGLTGRLKERVRAWVMRHTWDDVRTDFLEVPKTAADSPPHLEHEPISYATYYAERIQGRR